MLADRTGPGGAARLAPLRGQAHELAAAGLRHAAAVLARALGADEVARDEGRVSGPLALALALDPRAVPLVLVHVRRILTPAVAAARGGADLQAVADALGAVLGAHHVARAAHRVLLLQLEDWEPPTA